MWKRRTWSPQDPSAPPTHTHLHCPRRTVNLRPNKICRTSWGDSSALGRAPIRKSYSRSNGHISPHYISHCKYGINLSRPTETWDREPPGRPFHLPGAFLMENRGRLEQKSLHVLVKCTESNKFHPWSLVCSPGDCLRLNYKDASRVIPARWRTKASVCLQVNRLQKNPAAKSSGSSRHSYGSFIDHELINCLLSEFWSGSKESFPFFYEVIISIQAFWAALQRQLTWNRTLMGFKLRYIKEN